MNTGLKETKSRFLSLSLPAERKMGKIHSVFVTSFNVMVEGRLFNFSQQGMSLSAHGCIVDRDTMGQLLEACRPGDLVKVNKGMFSFYTPKEVFKVDTTGMAEMDLSIPEMKISPTSLSQSYLYAALQSIPFQEKIGLEWEDNVMQAVRTLKKLSGRSKEERKRMFDFLIGRGKGLTPSGDDILVGFTMIRKSVIGTDGFEEELQDNLESHNTTDISKAYYEAMFSGYVSSLFVSLIRSLESGKQANVSQLIEHIGYYGHTSGYDTLFGVYLGLQSLIHEMEEKLGGEKTIYSGTGWKRDING